MGRMPHALVLAVVAALAGWAGLIAAGMALLAALT